MEEIVNLIISILTSGVLFWTLLEIKKQRESMYKPDLCVPSQIFYASKNSNDFIWKRGLKEFKLKISNIGLGTAKNIRIVWEYKLNEMIEIIKKIDKESQFKIKKGDNFLEIETENMHKSINLQCLSFNDWYLKNNDSIEISFSSVYADLFSIFNYLLIKEQKIIFSQYHNKFPFPRIKISYEDIGNRKITKTILLKISPFMYSSGEKKFFEGEIIPFEIKS